MKYVQYILMGQKEVKLPPVPEKTLKEMVKEFSKTIMKQRREFQRQIFKLEANERKMKADLERMVKKNEPMGSKRIIAQNILRNQRFIQRYQKLDVQLQDVEFQLKTISTTDTLVNVMRTMSEMMGKANKNMNVQSIEQALTIFQTEMERGNIMAEQIEDVMNTGEEDIDDEAADKLISDLELNNIKGKPQMNEGGIGELDDFEARVNSIK